MKTRTYTKKFRAFNEETYNEHRAAVLALRQTGMTFPAIARSLGIGASTAHNMLNRSWEEYRVYLADKELKVKAKVAERIVAERQASKIPTNTVITIPGGVTGEWNVEKTKPQATIGDDILNRLQSIEDKIDHITIQLNENNRRLW
jgi:lambda repressor-like predicted transcriptional regulator